MSLFDDITSGLKQQAGGAAGQQGLLDVVMGLINNPQAGGLAGLVEQFKSKGLGDIVSSWVGTGQNQAISPKQIQDALGGAQVQQVASKLGVSPDQASASLAKMLPDVVDKLTPNGQIPSGDLLAQGISLLKGKLFGG